MNHRAMLALARAWKVVSLAADGLAMQRVHMAFPQLEKADR